MKTPRNADYLKFVRRHRCCACSPLEEETEEVRSQAAHVRMGNGGGIGLKPSDYRTVPLCVLCHQEQHQIGEPSFWDGVGQLGLCSSPDSIILDLLCEYAEKQKDLAKGAISALEQFLEEMRK